jgi:LuxR family maltose regulon positive regulatory protein
MSGVDEAVSGELTAAGFRPVVSKLYAPAPGLVPRRALLDLVTARDADLIIAVAPAGYGKSSFLAELARQETRPTAWVSLTTSDDDPASLLSYVALALDSIEPVDPALIPPLWSRSPTIETPAHSAFSEMLGSRQRPFVLILDDVHVLQRRDTLDTLAALVAEMPSGSRLALASRTAVELPLGRLRTRRAVVELGVEEVAFDEAETEFLLEQLGTSAEAADAAALYARTEGWPVAIYLAVLADSTSGSGSPTPISMFGGRHRYLVEYLTEELLAASDDLASFLLEASCFDRVSGALCDDVLGRLGSAALLETARRRNLLVISLDDRREWYRFHHLMAEFLRTELERRDPVRQRAIHRRASDWHHARGDADGAISHAVRGGDLDRAEALVVHWFGRYAIAGRNHTIDRWLRLFTTDQLHARPGLMLSAAHAAFTDGDPVSATQWLARAGAASGDHHPADARGPVAPVMLAVSRAVIADLTPAEMAAESHYAYERVDAGVGHPLACLASGAAAFLLGDVDLALRRLREGAATTLPRAIIRGSCLSLIAVVEADRGDWERATTTAREARRLVGDQPGPTAALVLAVSVLVETRAGRSAQADADRTLCRQHLTGLIGIAPWLNVQARIALARAAAMSGDRAEASTLGEEARQLARRMPDAVTVHEQLAGLRGPGRATGRASFGPSSLSTAELRVLQFLPTHLTSPEIAERLYVSRHTVKTQMISIYRKLGTNTRRGTVELAAAAGLLEAQLPDP